MPFDWGKNAPTPVTMGVIREEDDDSSQLDGLDSEVPEEDRKWLTTDQKKLKQLGAQERAAQKKAESVAKPQQPVQIDHDTLGMLGLSDHDFPENDDMTEVEYRLAKAQSYKMLINHQLLNSDTKAAEEVEYEVQEFVRTKLGELMGMTAAPAKQLDLGEMSALLRENMPFSDEQIQALQAVADRLLKSKEVAPAPQKPTAVQPVAAAPQPKPITVKPVGFGEEVKRGRGRPRKNPCPNCGQMICVCKQAVQQTMPTHTPEFHIETLPDGTRIKHVGDRRYKLVQKQVQYRDGTVKMEDIEMDVTPMPKAKGAVPFPNEAQVAMHAEVEAAGQLSKANNLLKAAIAVSEQKQQNTGE